MCSQVAPRELLVQQDTGGGNWKGGQLPGQDMELVTAGTDLGWVGGTKGPRGLGACFFSTPPASLQFPEGGSSNNISSLSTGTMKTLLDLCQPSRKSNKLFNYPISTDSRRDDGDMMVVIE